MISRRLTKSQKQEILEAYRTGEKTNVLAEKYNCSINTINRTVKSLISVNDYTLLKEKRANIIKENGKFDANGVLNKKRESFPQSISLTTSQRKDKDQNKTNDSDKNLDNIKVDERDSFDLDKSDDLSVKLENRNQFSNNQTQKIDNSLALIAPLVSNFDFDQDKESTQFEILAFDSLPESVYMIVDKKVELDLQNISDLPEWSFLPKNELERKAILLFYNQRLAKRSCSKNQRVIKIPNTNIFELTKSYLVLKGITRLILEGSIIALDD